MDTHGQAVPLTLCQKVKFVVNEQLISVASKEDVITTLTTSRRGQYDIFQSDTTLVGGNHDEDEAKCWKKSQSMTRTQKIFTRNK